MNKLILSAFIASSLMTGPGMLVGATGASAATCDSSAPAAWFRPGGYCDAIGGNSLTTPVDPPACEIYLLGEIKTGDRVRVADNCYNPCNVAMTMGSGLPEGVRQHVALITLCALEEYAE